MTEITACLINMEGRLINILACVLSVSLVLACCYCCFFFLLPDWILPFYFSGTVRQQKVSDKEGQVNNHCYLERAVPPSNRGLRWNMKSLLVKPSSCPTFSLKKKKTSRIHQSMSFLGVDLFWTNQNFFLKFSCRTCEKRPNFSTELLKPFFLEFNKRANQNYEHKWADKSRNETLNWLIIKVSVSSPASFYGIREFKRTPKAKDEYWLRKQIIIF